MFSGLLKTGASALYGAVLSTRHKMYDRGIFPCRKAPLVVVSVGNLVVGGTGKSQVALLLAKELAENSLKVAILSRGYKGTNEKGVKPLLIDPKIHTPSLCGDEAWMLAARLPEVAVIAGKDRYRSSFEAKREGALVAILDDGMQHRKLHRDFEVVVCDSSDPLGGGSLLPKGLLRDEPLHLAKAHYVLLVGPKKEGAREAIAKWTSAPQIEMEIEVEEVVGWKGSLHEVPVGVFCGIGNPNRFIGTVRSLGARVVTEEILSDHQKMGEKRLRKFAERAKEKGAKLLLCTEKDWVKLPQNLPLPLPLGWVRASLTVRENRGAWEEMKKRIAEAV